LLLLSNLHCFDRRFAAFVEDITVMLGTTTAVIDTIAIADIKAVSRAVSPNCVLYEPRKNPWKCRIKPARIDQVCH